MRDTLYICVSETVTVCEGEISMPIFSLGAPVGVGMWVGGAGGGGGIDCQWAPAQARAPSFGSINGYLVAAF